MTSHIRAARRFLNAAFPSEFDAGLWWKIPMIIGAVALIVGLMCTTIGSTYSLLQNLCGAVAMTLVTSPIILFWVIAPFTQSLKATNKRLATQLKLKEQLADSLTASLSKLAFQKRILDQHAIVSETDVAGTITYANDAFCRISQFSREELLGKNHRIVNSARHPPEFWNEMYDTLARGEVWQGEVCNKARDGSEYWVQATNSAVYDDRGKLLGYVSIRTDITDSKLHQQRLEHTQKLLMEATSNAEAANHAKSEFLATMSHEIRTPMNGVLGMLGLLGDCELTAEQQKLVKTARESADNLLVIINDILDYSKLEAGRIQLEVIPFSPHQILDGVVSLLKSRANAKHLSLELDLAPDLPLWITADPTRLRQILFNLIGNAIKFTDNGSVRAIVSHRTIDADLIEISFEIRDTGIGIPKEARNRLFTRFSQADGSTTRKFGGTGLGLAISKQLADMMGGAIGVESVVGKGSRFWFTIRARLSERPELIASPAATAYDELLDRKLRILVADDNHVNQMFVSTLLTKRGHTVDVVSNGLEALAAVQRCQYDVVLMDVQMPEMDGVVATRNIRKLGGPEATVPIIALTANAMSGQREEYLASGMDDYISKPIDPMQLFASLVRVYRGITAYLVPPLSQNSDGITGDVCTLPLGPEHTAFPVLDQSRIDELRKYLDSASLSAALMGFPAEAVECQTMLEAAVAKNDSEAISRAVHRLQGMASNFGASRLSNLLSQMNGHLNAENAVEQLPYLRSTISDTIATLASIS